MMDKLTKKARNGLDRIVSGDKFKKKEADLDLPDGFHLSPQRLAPKKWDQENSAVRKAKYLHSFKVEGEDQPQRVEHVNTILKNFQANGHGEKVLLVMSLAGIKVCNQEKESVQMTHAMHRISYASCDPDACLFCFMAREPKNDAHRQICYVFQTESSDEAEELNTICGTAFRVAYTLLREQELGSADSSQVTSRAQTFNDLIASQLETQKKQKEQEMSRQTEVLQEQLTRIATPHVADGLRELKEKRQKEQERIERQLCEGKQRTAWAKLSAGKAKHLPPGCRDSPPSSSPDRLSQLKEVMDSGAFRSYGSPVMSLKETIDDHFSRSPVTDETLMRSYARQSSEPAVARGGTGRQSGRYQNDSPSHGARHSIANIHQGDVLKVKDMSEAPPLPARSDSLNTEEKPSPVDPELESASWYQPGLPREISLEVLSHQEVGSFIVRDSTTHTGCFALSVKVPKFDNPSGISHYLIEKTASGYKLKGLEKEWPSLMALVTHHTVMPEMLPCPLKIPRNATNPLYRDRDDDDDNYQKISDFSGLLRNMRVQ